MKNIMIEEQKNKKFPLFYEAIEYFERNDTEETLITEDTNQLENRRSNRILLRDEMLNELNNLRDIFGNNPDSKLKTLSKKERECFSKFIKFYQMCPICYQYNHYRNLKKLYFDESKKELKEKLIKIMDLRTDKFNNIKIRFGIPCCNCYKKLISD